MKPIILFALLTIISFSSNAQTGKFAETFINNNNKWSLATPVPKDSASIEIAKGSLTINNNRVKPAIVGIVLPAKSRINLRTDDEWTATINVKRISGDNTLEYGFYIGQATGGEIKDGLFFSINALGYFVCYEFAGGKGRTLNNWSPFAAIHQKENAINEIKLVKRKENLYALINNNLAYVGRALISANAVGVRVFGKQKIAFSNISIESVAAIDKKTDKEITKDLLTIIAASDSAFKKAIGAKDSRFNRYPTWLPGLGISKSEFWIFGDIPGMLSMPYISNGPVSYKQAYYEQSGSADSATTAAKVKRFKTLIEKALVNFTVDRKVENFSAKTIWMSTNPKLQKNLAITMEEFDIDKNYFMRINIISAPGLAPKK